MSPLRRTTAPNGVVLLQSPALAARGVPHAFTTRIGGVSDAPYDTLNLSGPVSAGGSDREERRRHNHSLLLDALDCADHEWVGLHLAHGIDVHVCDAGWPRAGNDPSPHGDAVIASQRGRMLKVTTADCVGVLLASEDGRIVGVVHAGWRGAAGGIVGRAVATLATMGDAAPDSLVAAIGPAIGLEAFEVGEEVAAAFESVGLAGFVQRRPVWTRPHVDLHGVVRRQLELAGVRPDRIDGLPTCTASHPDLFFSHRRDAGRTGRLAAVVAPRA